MSKVRNGELLELARLLVQSVLHGWLRGRRSCGLGSFLGRLNGKLLSRLRRERLGWTPCIVRGLQSWLRGRVPTGQLGLPFRIQPSPLWRAGIRGVGVESAAIA